MIRHLLGGPSHPFGMTERVTPQISRRSFARRDMEAARSAIHHEDRTLFYYLVFFTVTVKVLVALLPQLSLAVTVTVVIPIGKKLPDAGLAMA